MAGKERSGSVLGMRPVPRHRWILLTLAVVVTVSVACGSSSDTATNGIVTPDSTGFKAKGTTVPGTDVVPTETTTTTAAGGTTTSLGSPTLTDSSTISTVGLDKVHFGMTLAEAEQAAGSPFAVATGKGTNCFVGTPEKGPAGVGFLLSDGRVERVDVNAPPIATRSGAKVGSTEAQIKELYPGQIEVQARPDGQPGNALVFVPKDAEDAKFRLVFLTDGTAVSGYRAGRVPQVLAATGCGK